MFLKPLLQAKVTLKEIDTAYYEVLKWLEATDPKVFTSFVEILCNPTRKWIQIYERLS